MKESASAEAIDARHDGWKARLPKDEGDLWGVLTAFDGKEQAALFAHCASSAVNALYEPANLATMTAGSPAHSVRQKLDHANASRPHRRYLTWQQVGWKPTADNYLGRVTKPRILEAVREAKGEPSVQLIDHLKKGDMALGKPSGCSMARAGCPSRSVWWRSMPWGMTPAVKLEPCLNSSPIPRTKPSRMPKRSGRISSLLNDTHVAGRLRPPRNSSGRYPDLPACRILRGRGRPGRV